MTANVVSQRILVNNPCIEVVTLDSVDGRTYVSRKFQNVTCALVGKNDAADDDHINVVTDGSGTVTINHNGATGEDITLVLFGKPGVFTP